MNANKGLSLLECLIEKFLLKFLPYKLNEMIDASVKYTALTEKMGELWR